MISSNPSDEATSESEPESSAQSVPESVGVDPAPRPTRRSFTAAYKAEIVAEYEGAPHGEKSAVLRREGLYHSHIKEWASASDAGALSGLTDAPMRARRRNAHTSRPHQARTHDYVLKTPGWPPSSLRPARHWT